MARSSNSTLRAALACLALATTAAGCAATPDSEEEPTGTADSAMSRAIHSSYGITTFGGAGDYQPMACGLHSRAAQTSQPWYVASSQRYGCKKKLKLVTGTGKCVVVQTEDAGPASWVENKAGMPILDVSPAAAKHLFGVSGLGWSDLKRHGAKYKVSTSTTTLPLGPCDGRGSDPTPNDEPSPSSPAPSGSAQACSSDGQCNPGNDGAGLICEGGACVAGCRRDAQCPGITRCVSGQCQ